VSHARRLVATPFTPSPGLAQRGLGEEAPSSTRVFRAEDVTITVGQGTSRGRLFGLVVLAGSPPESLAGRRVRLLPREGVSVVSSLDDLGNFEVTDLPPGQYALEIDLPDGVVVVQELHLR
jgi:hypothetical protein